MKIWIIIFMILIISALLVISNNKLAMSKEENAREFSNLYIKWLEQIYENFQAITGHAVKLDWFP